MPSRRRAGGPVSIFENRTMIAQECDASGVWTQCSLSLVFNQARSQCMVSLRLRARFEGYGGDRDVILQLPPENLLQLDDVSGPERIPVPIEEHIRHHIGVQSYEQVLILSLAMNAPGKVIAPQSGSALTPGSGHRTQVQNFQCLCRATQLLLYIPIPDLSEERKRALKGFVSLATTGKLVSVPIDPLRVNGGRGGSVTTWEIFHIPELPPSYVEHVERELGKRTREATSWVGAPRKRPARGSGIPGFSTRSHVSNSDSETDFSAQAFSPPSGASKAPLDPASLAASVLRETVREILKDTLRAELESMLPVMLREILPETLFQVWSPMLDRLAPEVLDPLVKTNLPELVEEYMGNDGTVEDYIQSVEVRIQEQADGLDLELQETRDECLKEIGNAERDALERLRNVDWDEWFDEIRGLSPSQESHGGMEARKKVGRNSRLGKGLGTPDGSYSEGELGKLRERNKMGRERDGEENGRSSPGIQRDEGSALPRIGSNHVPNASTADTETGSQSWRAGGTASEAGLDESLGAPRIEAHKSEDTEQDYPATDSSSPQARTNNGGSTPVEASKRGPVETGPVRELDNDLGTIDADGGEGEGWEYHYAQFDGILTSSRMDVELYTPTEPNTQSDPDIS